MVKSPIVKSFARILLVDDEPLVLEILELAFRQSGFEVVSTQTSQAALKLLDRSHFDGLICDVRLEHMDGFDLLGLARRHNPHLVAVLITGAPNDLDAVRAQGMDAEYLVKPLSLSKLIAIVQERLSIATPSSIEASQESNVARDESYKAGEQPRTDAQYPDAHSQYTSRATGNANFQKA